MAEYSYVFTALGSSVVAAELPVSGASFSRAINDTGGFSGTVPLSLVDQATGYELINATDLDVRNTAVYVLRDGIVVWGGRLRGIQISVTDQRLNLAAKGFWDHFNKLKISEDFTYTDTEQFTIVEDLLDNAQTGQGDLGVTIVKHPSVGSGILRDRTYLATDQKPTAEAIKQLSEVIHGFDFELTAGGVWGSFTKTLDVWYPRQGRTTDIIWEAGTNINLLDYTIDGDNFANRVDEIGSGDGDLMLFGSASASELSAVPLQVTTELRKSVKESATLVEHAEATLAFAKNARRTMRVEVINQPDAPFGSYIPGDSVHVKAEYGYLQINDWWRIMSMTVKPDDSGSETVECDLAPLADFLIPQIEDEEEEA